MAGELPPACPAQARVSRSAPRLGWGTDGVTGAISAWIGGELLMPGMGKVVVARDGERGMVDTPFLSWALGTALTAANSSPLSPPPRPCSTPQLAPRPRLRAPSLVRRSGLVCTACFELLPLHRPTPYILHCRLLELRLLPSVDRPRTLNLEPLRACSYIARGWSAHANLRITAGLEAGLRRPTLSHWTDEKGA